MEELELPKSVVLRIAKEKLGESTQLSKDARTVLSQSATVFVSYIAALANDIAREQNGKTLSAAHVVQALTEAEFGQFSDVVKEVCEAQKSKKRKAAAASKARKSAAAASSASANGEGAAGSGGEDEEGEEEADENDHDDEADRPAAPASPSKMQRTE